MTLVKVIKVKVVKCLRKVKKPKLVRKNIKNGSIKALRVLKNVDFDKYNEYIEEFINTLASKGCNYDFTFMSNNLRDLKIVVVPELENNNMAVYDGSLNILNIAEDYLDRMDEIIYHELFHMSSRLLDGDDCFIGFQRNYLFNCFNEGYTEVLTKRYFGDKSKDTPYLFEMILAEIVEFIIGKDIMEKLYSRADSLGMLVEFSKYTDKEETTYITLGNIDRMSDYYDKQEYKESMDWCRNILIVLIHAFMNKCRMGISKNKVDEFFKLFPLFYTYDDEDFDIFTQEEINDYKKKCYAILGGDKKLKKN